jgi:hypothetical protein
MKLEMAIPPTRLLAMCLGPEAGGAFDIREVPCRSPGPDEIVRDVRRRLRIRWAVAVALASSTSPDTPLPGLPARTRRL